MFSYIPISYLNDFTFCPRSIYYHVLYQDYQEGAYKDTPQTEGTAAHRTIEEGSYSTRAEVLHALPVCSSEYGLYGKIDTFNTKTGELRERKKRITHIYDGYIFQLFAQHACLTEMGYTVTSMSLYSMDDNKRYPVLLPDENLEKKQAFEKLVRDIRAYVPEHGFTQNPGKCARCIYNALCDVYNPNELSTLSA